MKLLSTHLLFCLCFLLSEIGFSQSTEKQQQTLNLTPVFRIEIGELTQFRLLTNDGYSIERIEAMKDSNPNRLLYLDYYYSKSFQIKPGQNYTTEQYLLIDMAKYYDLRDETQSKEIYDAPSKLTLILDSKTKVLEMRDQLTYPNGKPVSVQKYKTN